MDASTFLSPVDTLRAAKLCEDMTVADFGAGSGHFTLAAAQTVGNRASVWAVDGCKDFLSRIKNHATAAGLGNVEVVRGDVEKEGGSNLPAEHFDLVIMSNLLFAVKNKSAAIAEAYRVLRNGGRVLAIDWRDSFNCLGPHPDNVITADDARDLFKSGGFSYVEDIPAGGYHWGFVVRKKPNYSAQ